MNFNEFKRKIYQKFDLNLDGYKEKQLKRRIDTLMQGLNFTDYGDYLQALQKDEKQLLRFLDKVTINVSEFFRNPEIFKILEDDIFPKLLANKQRLKIWSAACSNGCEPYSVAIILEDLNPRISHRIEATDIDRKILAAAKAGVYNSRFVKNVTPERLRKYFLKDNDQYTICENIRNKVSFKYHDLLLDSYGTGYDLIICRNVTIYFTSESQDMIYTKFYQSLAPGGILFIGATENMLRYREFGFTKISPWFYQK
ncbi:MAG: CheR family methyltransferase [Zhaonellaceae bacterium]|nr:protein-glutamate O-methyltransferase CheR [Clostridia bacterium]